MVGPELVRVSVRYEHNCEASPLLVYLRVEVLAPEIGFFEEIVEHLYAALFQKVRNAINIVTFFAGE
jgi:hypothetical protein